ncbi:MAG: hypothetical protein CMP11_02090 [Zetaproteobacteria bacterium]|nr:hypothetical protein [Pseudobdellovibrionaceae bacterium]
MNMKIITFLLIFFNLKILATSDAEKSIQNEIFECLYPELNKAQEYCTINKHYGKNKLIIIISTMDFHSFKRANIIYKKIIEKFPSSSLYHINPDEFYTYVLSIHQEMMEKATWWKTDESEAHGFTEEKKYNDFMISETSIYNGSKYKEARSKFEFDYFTKNQSRINKIKERKKTKEKRKKSRKLKSEIKENHYNHSIVIRDLKDVIDSLSEESVSQNDKAFSRYAAIKISTSQHSDIEKPWLPKKNLQKKMEDVMELWIQSAKNENPIASYNLGFIYGFGFGVKKDLVLAFKYFEHSALRGLHQSQKMLSQLYKEGLGCEKNEEAANFWFRASGPSLTIYSIEF